MELAHKTGYLVRIAPSEVACSDPEAIRVRRTTELYLNELADLTRQVIYGTKNVFAKVLFYPNHVAMAELTSCQTDYYDAWAPPNNGYVGHFPARDEKVHAERRRIVNSVYSMSSVLESEHSIDSCTELFCETMRDFAKQKTVIDLNLWINM